MTGDQFKQAWEGLVEHVVDWGLLLVDGASKLTREDQVQRDCAAMCKHCHEGNVPVLRNSHHWCHKLEHTGLYVICGAHPIRAKFAYDLAKKKKDEAKESKRYGSKR